MAQTHRGRSDGSTRTVLDARRALLAAPLSSEDGGRDPKRKRPTATAVAVFGASLGLVCVVGVHFTYPGNVRTGGGANSNEGWKCDGNASCKF